MTGKAHRPTGPAGVPDYEYLLPPISGGDGTEDDPPAPPDPPKPASPVSFTQQQVDSMVAAAKRDAIDRGKAKATEAEQRGYERGKAEALKDAGVDGQELHQARKDRDKAVADAEQATKRAEDAETELQQWYALADTEYEAGLAKLPANIRRLAPRSGSKLERREWMLEALRDEEPAAPVADPPAPGAPPAPVPPDAPPPGPPPKPNAVTVEQEMAAQMQQPHMARRLNRPY